MMNTGSLNSGALNSGAVYFNNAYGSGFGPEWLKRFEQPDALGEVITFYSYKGGTGRTMALANCAGLMAEQWPSKAKPILLIDFDLEAPGLHQYLRDYIPPAGSLDDHPGTLELFEALNRNVAVALLDGKVPEACLSDEACNQLISEFDFAPYLVKTALAPVWLIKAGCFDKTYGKRLSRMQWQNLFKSAPGIFRALAARWAREYACTFIDARTGLSDTSSICTMLLPDVLTVVFTPNRQSLSGVKHIVHQAQSYRARSADLRPLRVYPLPSRVEQTSEDARDTWRRGVAHHPTFGQVDGYQPLFERVLTISKMDADSGIVEELDGYFDAVQIPHSPDYAFGERLCFGQQTTKDRLSLRSAFEAFLPWLTSGAQPWESPLASLDASNLAQWIVKLSPPEGDEPNAFHAWLNKLKQATADTSHLGYFVLRDALSRPDRQTKAFADLASLLPPGVLIKALALMHAEDWQAASTLLTLMIDNVKSQGLPSEWESVPRRWLEYQRSVQPVSYFQPWLKLGVQEAMENWVDAAHLSRGERWKWMACLGGVLSELGVMSLRRRVLAEQLLAQQREVLGLEHTDTLNSKGNYGATLRALGDLPEALAILEEVVAIRQRVSGAEDPCTIASMSDLASTLQAKGELKAAQAMQEHALEIRQRILGPEHPDTLTSISDLASTLQAKGELKAAQAMQEHALEIRQRILGPEHPDTLTSSSDLASTFLKLGELPRAQAMEQRVLVIRQRVLGPEHPDTLSSMNNLALTLEGMGDLSSARAMQEQVLAIQQRVLGPEHPDTLTSMNNLALTLQRMGDLPAAQAMQEQELGICQRVLGPEHPDTLASMNNLAITLRGMGDLSAARVMQERVLTICQQVLGSEHPDTLTSMNQLAITLRATGDLSAARAMPEQVLAIQQRVLGPEHPDTLASMNNLAITLRAMGDLPAARAMQEQVLAIQQRELGPEHPDTLSSMNNLAITLRAMGDLPAARAMQEQEQAICQRVLGPEHSDTLSSMNNLAITLRAMGDLSSARAMQEQVLAIQQRVLGPNHPNTLAIFSNLMQASQKEGDSAEVSRLLDLYPDLARAMFQKLSSPASQSGSGE